MNARAAEILRIAVLLRDGNTCVYCGAERGEHRLVNGAWVFVKVVVDHVFPEAWGGKSVPRNLVCACERCNLIKGTMDGETFAFMLKRMGLIKTRKEVLRRIEIATDKRLDRVRAARIYALHHKKK